MIDEMYNLILGEKGLVSDNRFLSDSEKLEDASIEINCLLYSLN